MPDNIPELIVTGLYIEPQKIVIPADGLRCKYKPRWLPNRVWPFVRRWFPARHVPLTVEVAGDTRLEFIVYQETGSVVIRTRQGAIGPLSDEAVRFEATVYTGDSETAVKVAEKATAAFSREFPEVITGILDSGVVRIVGGAMSVAYATLYDLEYRLRDLCGVALDICIHVVWGGDYPNEEFYGSWAKTPIRSCATTIRSINDTDEWKRTVTEFQLERLLKMFFGDDYPRLHRRTWMDDSSITYSLQSDTGNVAHVQKMERFCAYMNEFYLKDECTVITEFRTEAEHVTD